MYKNQNKTKLENGGVRISWHCPFKAKNYAIMYNVYVLVECSMTEDTNCEFRKLR